MAQTLFDKIWNEHVVNSSPGFPDLLYVDNHVINKLTSPKAFEALKKRKTPVFRPHQTVAESHLEHAALTPVCDLSNFQTDLLTKNCNDFGIHLAKQMPLTNSSDIVALPGQTLAADPERTTNLGAFGILALSIQPTQVEQVLATQCLLTQKPRRMKIEVNGKLQKGLTAKDINHYLISEISLDGASGYFVEFAGDTIRSLDMEGRMAICNMSREIGGLGGIIAPDEQTFVYLKELRLIPEGALAEDYLDFWKFLCSDENAAFDEVLEFDAEDILPASYGIGISKLLLAAAKKETRLRSYESAGILEGYNDTDYMLGHTSAIEEFESSMAQRNLMV